MSINPSIFKAYDVRGLYPQEVNEDAARLIGRAFVAYLDAKRIAVSRDMPAVQRLITPRAALLAALGLMSLNYALTSRWAAIPGSLHGAKQPVFLAILAVTILLAIVRWPRQRIVGSHKMDADFRLS